MKQRISRSFNRTASELREIRQRGTQNPCWIRRQGAWNRHGKHVGFAPDRGRSALDARHLRAIRGRYTRGTALLGGRIAPSLHPFPILDNGRGCPLWMNWCSTLPELSCRFSACSLLFAVWELRRLRLFCKFSRKINPGRPKGTNRDPNKSEPPKQVRGPWGVTSSLRLACIIRDTPRSFNRLP